MVTSAMVAHLPHRWLSLAVTSLALPTSQVAAQAVASLRGHGGGRGTLLQRHSATGNSREGGAFDDGPQNPCSCDCCDVVERLPGEVAFGAGLKCSPSTQHSTDVCGEQCSPVKEDRVLQDEIVDFDRFCFFECKPAAGPKAPVTSQCVAFSEQEAFQTIDPAGNPIDPAFLYGAPLSNQPPVNFFRNGPAAYSAAAAAASANLLSTRSKLSDGVKPADVDVKIAEQAAKMGMTSAMTETKDANLEAARLREMEHQKQKELHKMLKDSGNSVVTLDPVAGIQDLDAAAKRARANAEDAAVIASKAVEYYDGGRKKLWKSALSEAGKEVVRWNNYAEEKAHFIDKPTWQTRANKKAQEASKPYVEGLLRAQDSVNLYNEKGFAMAKSASALWKEATQEDAANANKLPRSTIAEANVAQSDMLDARDKAKEAQNMASEARQYFATAAEVRKGIPVYQYNAQKAAAEAVAGMNLEGT